jgi:hypothetical protein
MINENVLKGFIYNQKLKYLKDLKYIFLDIEYLRDKREKNSYLNTKIYSIQYAIFTIMDVYESKFPELNILFIWNFENEKKLLESFVNLFHRLTKRLGTEERLIPIGYQILMDLGILFSKYSQMNLIESEPFSFITETRYIDLIHQSRIITGLIDPKRESFAQFTNFFQKSEKGENVHQLIKTWFNDNEIQKLERELIIKTLKSYIINEFEENWHLIKFWFNQIPKNYTNSQKKILEEQKESMNKKRAYDRYTDAQKSQSS